MAQQIGYNERLFSGSRLRRFYHMARYNWLRRVLAARGAEPLRVIEIGCFDGKAIDYMPAAPARYVGLDANWDHGLNIGRERWKDHPEVTLIQTRDPETLMQFEPGFFNVAIALETLEHIPVPAMRAYLAQLARVTDGSLFVSVPNEMGPVFVGKHLAQRMLVRKGDTYTAREFMAAALLKPEKIDRLDGHKGFSYRSLISDIGEHFDVERVEGLPPMGLPPLLSLTVGITARTRR